MFGLLDGHPDSVKRLVEQASDAADEGDLNGTYHWGTKAIEEALALTRNGWNPEGSPLWVVHINLASVHMLRAKEAGEDHMAEHREAARHAQIAANYGMHSEINWMGLQGGANRLWTNLGHILASIGGHASEALHAYRVAHGLREAETKGDHSRRRVRQVRDMGGVMSEMGLNTMLTPMQATQSNPADEGTLLECREAWGCQHLTREMRGRRIKNDPEMYHFSELIRSDEANEMVALFDEMMSDANKIPGMSCLRAHSKHYPEAYQEWSQDQKAGRSESVWRALNINNPEKQWNVTLTDSFDVRPELCAKSTAVGLPRKLADGATSESILIARGESRLVDSLEDRVAALTGFRHDTSLPNNGSRMHYTQLLRYLPGGEYGLHADCADHMDDQPKEAPSARGPERSHTLIMYLSDVEQGGNTEFPALNISVRPRRGDGIFFRNLDQVGICNPNSMHRSAPVRQGVKMVLQRSHIWHLHVYICAILIY